jgi:hypothetical protein
VPTNKALAARVKPQHEFGTFALNRQRCCGHPAAALEHQETCLIGPLSLLCVTEAEVGLAEGVAFASEATHAAVAEALHDINAIAPSLVPPPASRSHRMRHRKNGDFAIPTGGEAGATSFRFVGRALLQIVLWHAFIKRRLPRLFALDQALNWRACGAESGYSTQA